MDKATSSKFFGKIVILVIILALIGVIYYFARPDKAIAPSEENEVTSKIKGVIAYIDGHAEYRQNNGAWQRASIDQVLEEGDSVEVIGEGKVVINLDEGSVLRLNSNSAVTLVSLSNSLFVISNDKGELYTRVEKAENRSFDVLAGEAVYKSMGTAYKTINKADKNGVEVYQSKVKVIVLGEEKAIVEEGNKYLVINKVDVNTQSKIIEIKPIEKDEFVKWNLDEDQKINILDNATEQKTEEDQIEEKIVTTTVVKQVETVKTEIKPVEKTVPTTSDGPVKSISLKSTGSGGLAWTVNGYSKSGYKVVWSKTSKPTYPTRKTDRYLYYSDPGVKSATIKAFDGTGTYYVRVCEYLSGKCGVYSNEITVSLTSVSVEKTTDTSSAVTSISLKSTGSGGLAWTVNGYSKSGYKVVWSKTSKPTYPTRNTDQYLYFSDPGVKSATVNAFDDGGVYYVRVCEYLGGKCGVYSNEITISL